MYENEAMAKPARFPYPSRYPTLVFHGIARKHICLYLSAFSVYILYRNRNKHTRTPFLFFGALVVEGDDNSGEPELVATNRESLGRDGGILFLLNEGDNDTIHV